MTDVPLNAQNTALAEEPKGQQLAAHAHSDRRRGPRVREIDFSRPTKFTQEQQRRIEREHETFCRTAATQLSAELRTAIELEVTNISQLTWLSALGEIPQPSIYAVVGAEPLGTKVLFSAELRAVRRLITRLLGGSDPGKEPERPLTEIELALARRIFTTLVHGLALTWRDLLGIDLALDALETQQQSIQLAPPSEPSLVVTIEAREEETSSTLCLAIPHRAIEPVIDRLRGPHYGEAASEDEADPAADEALRASLAAVQVEVRAEVAAVELTIDEVLALREGDVLRLGASAAAGVTILAGNQPLHRGQPGRSGSRRAVHVLERLELGQ